jgi:hypothetical protein
MADSRYIAQQVDPYTWIVTNPDPDPEQTHGLPQTLTEANGEEQTFCCYEDAQEAANNINHLNNLDTALTYHLQKLEQARHITLNAVTALNNKDTRHLLNILIQEADLNTLTEAFHQFSEYAKQKPAEPETNKDTQP